jgi:hypothetical protein
MGETEASGNELPAQMSAFVIDNHQTFASKENFMRVKLDEHAWNQGFEDSRQGKPLSWASGYIEG